MKTNKAVFFICSLFCLVLVPMQLLSQQVTVQTRLVNERLEVFFLNNFDINRPGAGIPFFFLDVTNQTSSNQRVMLRMRVHTQELGQLLEAETDFFPMTPNQLITMSNNDLWTNTGPYRFVTSSVSDNVLQELLDDILRTGRLPTDVYIFDVEAMVEDGGMQDNDGFEIKVTNPGKLDLIMPGMPAGRRDDCPMIYTNLPQFRWESNFNKFRLVIATIRPGEDPESSLNIEPRLTRLLILAGTGDLADLAGLPFNDKPEVISTTSFQFPPSGEVLILRPGDEVVWRITGLVETSAGIRQFDSEIFCFKVADLDNLGSGREQFDFILRSLLGNDYETLFGNGGEFSGFVPTGMRFDGQPIAPPDLMPRLQSLKENYKGYRVE
jgi:hypothetical protein